MIGYAICGSFCTHARSLTVLENLLNNGADVLPIVSEIAAATDTRFGKAADKPRGDIGRDGLGD